MDPETKEQRLAEYLREQAADDTVYLRAKHVADELELSPREIGIYLGRLEERDDRGLDVEKWSRSRGAWTWRVSFEG